MNSRYLYRAKKNNLSEWVVGYYAQIGKKHSILRLADEYFNESGERRTGCEIVEINPYTLCQSTGREDMEGNLIWENDILSYIDVTSTESGYSERGCAGVVAWDDETLSFQVSGRLSAESYEVLDGECRVIGNIFDNKELLE